MDVARWQFGFFVAVVVCRLAFAPRRGVGIAAAAEAQGTTA